MRTRTLSTAVLPALLALVLILGACASSAPTMDDAPMPAGEEASPMPAEVGTPMADAPAPMLASSPVLLPVPDDPSVSFNLWFKVGSQNDPAGKEGLASLTAALISDGATRSRSYQEILEALYPLAAGYRVQVGKEMTTVTGRTHRDNLDAYLDLFTSAVLEPAFNQEDFDRLRSNQLNYLEKDLRYSQDEELAKAALQAFIFEGTGYEHPPEGTVTGLSSITLNDVKAFYRRHYTRGNVVLGVGGGYPESLIDDLRASLVRLPAGNAEPTPPPQPKPIQANGLLLIDKANSDASISFGYPIDVHRGDADYYALWLANSWLGEHRNSSSHLYAVIREARGMNYGDYSYIEWFPQGGFRSFPAPNAARQQQIFEVWIRSLPNEQAHFALRAAVRELEKLIENGMTRKDFELTKSFLSKYHLQYAPTTQTRLGYAIDDRFYGIGDPGHLANFQKALDALTLEQVNAALKRHLRADRLKIAIVTGEAEAMKQALADDAPSPMTYASDKPASVLEEDKLIEAYPLNIDAENIHIQPVDEAFQ